MYLYGFSELIKYQEGYSYNPILKEDIKEWPSNYIVIADDGADPYVLDLNSVSNDDAPVLFSEHGQGDWKFKKYTESFQEFLEKVGIEH